MSRGIRRAAEATIGIVCVAGAVAWLSGGCEQRVAPEPVDVAGRAAQGEVAPVREVRVAGVEWASGEVASARQASVSSRVLARIEEVRVRAGSSVSEGDVVVVLDARDLRARAREAEEALRASQARLELARREHARTQDLLGRGVAPERRLDEVTSELRAARAEVAGRSQALDEARTAASFAEIRSPVTGRVVDRLAEPGDTAIPGRPLLQIYDPALLRVEAPVRESLAVQLAVGDALRVELPAVASPVEGRVDEIVPFAERGARTLLVKVSLPRTQARLFAGMFARVAIPVGERRRLLVPEAAVERLGQLEFVSVLAPDGVAERRLVTTGERLQEGFVEVLSGLRVGERVRVAGTAGEVSAAEIEEAAAAIAALRERLGQALRRALAEGAEQAIDVCRHEAPRIAQAVTREGLAIGRTSRRLRNPANAPEAWMLPLLDAFEAAEPAPGSARSVDLGARGTGYVEPIYTQPLCTTCHGRAVAPGLLAVIRDRYPDDQAVGYGVGEFRGLFWAVIEGGRP